MTTPYRAASSCSTSDTAVDQNTTHDCVSAVYAPSCRSASRLPGSMYASDTRRPGPSEVRKVRSENRGRSGAGAGGSSSESSLGRMARDAARQGSGTVLARR